eukprot:CAMPEP_0179048712 /NCGR_PEP_ID=MMETSP0796-20121207/19847_1 /TAXON_ID=73915 /ORGANISM="Pyrodinium bahamense, Strain pbaha01" /LENGTH=148 /DNA_ID=CAMNT_0020745183 /DNA_START=120 /DNA_END=564 /DNA_ORIENTATION=-
MSAAIAIIPSVAFPRTPPGTRLVARLILRILCMAIGDGFVDARNLASDALAHAGIVALVPGPGSGHDGGLRHRGVVPRDDASERQAVSAFRVVTPAEDPLAAGRRLATADASTTGPAASASSSAEEHRMARRVAEALATLVRGTRALE